MMMTTAKLFQNGQGQAVRLPRAFRLPGKEVSIKKVGNAIVLIPMDHPWETLFESLSQFSDDFMREREQPTVQTRDGDPFLMMDILHLLTLCSDHNSD
jgi:antitoxin VapB